MTETVLPATSSSGDHVALPVSPQTRSQNQLLPYKLLSSGILHNVRKVTAISGLSLNS